MEIIDNTFINVQSSINQADDFTIPESDDYIVPFELTARLKPISYDI